MMSPTLLGGLCLFDLPINDFYFYIYPILNRGQQPAPGAQANSAVPVPALPALRKPFLTLAVQQVRLPTPTTLHEAAPAAR